MKKLKNTNIALPFDLWLEAKAVAAKREISLNQLVKNGLHLVLNHDETIVVDANGKTQNDLRGLFAQKLGEVLSDNEGPNHRCSIDHAPCPACELIEECEHEREAGL